MRSRRVVPIHSGNIRPGARRCRVPLILAAVAAFAAMTPTSANAALMHFVADPINPANECPICPNAGGTGCGAFTLDTTTGVVRYYIRHTQVGETASHVHGPAGPCPATAGILVPLPVGMIKSGTYNLTAVQQVDMQASRHYVNIHTGGCPAGAIRGQIIPATATGACCLPDNSCIDTLPSTCQCLGGVFSAVGTACSGTQACCLPDSTCIDTDPLCCALRMGTAQGAGSNCLNVVCQPQGCAPLPDGSACQQVICPDMAAAQCIPRCMNFNPANGQIKITDCDCRSPNECHVAFGPAGPECVGNCPQGFHCETTTTQLADGSVEVCCDCVEDPPYMNWVIADDFCINPSCAECRCDFDGDGVCTTFADLQMLLGCFGPVTPACKFADLNCDGFVNNADEQIWVCLAGGNPPEQCCPDVAPRPTPITQVQWYGSYLDPEFDPSITPVPRQVDGWLIAIHRDVPPQPCPAGTNYDACGVVSAPDPLGCVTFLPDGAPSPIPLTPPVGPGCQAGAACVIPPPGYWRICARYLPNCSSPCSPVPGALCVLQFLPCESGVSRPDKLVAQWAFNPQAIQFFNTDTIGCDEHAVYCYSTRLVSGCLVHNNAGPDEIDPLAPVAFNPRPGVVYWLSIQAEVGHFISGPPQCEELPTGNVATREFWGWHTTPPGYHMKDDAYMGSLEMSCRGGWIYNWMNHLHWSQPDYAGCADDPTKSMDMSFYLLSGAAGGPPVVIWCQPYQPGPPPPADPPGPARPIPHGDIDLLVNTVADAVVEFFPPGPPVVNINATGPTRVWRDDPQIALPAMTIDTEIVQMNLIGNSGVGPVIIQERPDQHSTGKISGPGSDPFLPYPYWPVDSFFDVWVRIQLPGAPVGYQQLFTQVPVHMDAVGGLWEIPPSNADYNGPGGGPVLLFDESNPAQPVGQLLQIHHRVGYLGGIDVHSDTDWAHMPMVCICPGDTNADGILNGADIQSFVDCLFNVPPPPAMLGCPCDCADVDNDGLVNLADIMPFVDQLMQVPKAVCPPEP